jgi:hypothetical protein
MGEWRYLNFGTRWRRLVSVFPSHFTAPDTQRIGGPLGPRACLDVMEKKGIFCPYLESKPNSSVVQPAA